MGGASSRAAARASKRAAPAAEQAVSGARVRAQASLDKLPETSAVRKDAELAEQFDQWRVAQEQRLDGSELEQESQRDDGLQKMMFKTMQKPEGQITYREQLLPMYSGELAKNLESQAKAEGAEIETRYQARDEADEASDGRLDTQTFTEFMHALQNNRGDATALKHLAAMYRVPLDTVQQVAQFYSIPDVHSALIGREQGMVAEWK